MYKRKVLKPLLYLSTLSILIIITISLFHPLSPFTDLQEEVRSEHLADTQINTYQGNLPMRFEKNDGQTGKSVDFLCKTVNQTMLLSANRIQVILPDTAGWLEMQLVGANAHAKAAGVDKLLTKSNYFIGKNPEKWLVEIPNYTRVKYSEVYAGIDLEYYGNQGQLEYDFIVTPGSNPGVISLQFEGMESVTINEKGDLILSTDDSEMIMQEPLAYQDRGGKRERIAAAYFFQGENRVGFRVGNYDPARPLVIDPVLAYSTYLGGAGSEGGMAIAVDSLGNTYITGETEWDFPVHDSLVQETNAGVKDVFVAKLNAAGSALIYATYIGGSPDGSGLGGDDVGRAIAIDPEGNAYVTGTTYSDDFPLENAMQTEYRGADIVYGDAFVVKLNPTGTKLIYSTYLGGHEDEAGFDIQADRSGHAYVVGYTSSDNFPVQGAYQSTLKGYSDGFISKIKPDGSDFVFSTYFGGSFGDRCRGIAIDKEENIYLTGTTSSDDFHLEAEYQEAILYTGPDAFVTKMNPLGTELIFSTYLTGTGSDPNYNHGDEGTSIAVDTLGYVYVAGTTQSPDFPMINAVQPQNNGPYDGFVTKFKPDGSSPVYSTYLGGMYHEGGLDIDVDFDGNAYIAGYTQSSDFEPVNAIQSSLNGSNDVFVVKINPSGSDILFSTFLGGSGFDGNFGSEDRHGIAVDQNGLVYVTGRTSSTDFPLDQAMQEIHGGSGDAFVTKIDIDPKINWINITGNYTLPDGIQLFEGTRSDPKLKAFYIDADLNRPELSVRPYIRGIKTSVPVRQLNQEMDAYASINGGFFSGSHIHSAVVYPYEVKAQNVSPLIRFDTTYPVIRGFFGMKSDRTFSVDWIYHFGSNLSDIYTFSQPLSYSLNDPDFKVAPLSSNGSSFSDLHTGIGGGPVLIKDNSVRITYNEEIIWGSGIGAIDKLNPRTAVGYTADNHVIMLVVDGRSDISDGVGLPELAQIMSDLDCVEALNLDGGGSSQMAIGDDFVNSPSDDTPRAVPAILSIVHTNAVDVIPPWAMYGYAESEDTEMVGGWIESTDPGAYGSTKAFVIPSGEGMNYIQYQLELPQEAEYEVYAWWVAAPDRCSDAPIIIYHKNGIDTVRVDQTGYGSFWNIIGNYTFTGTSSDKIKITDGGTIGGYICADAIKIATYDDVTGIPGPLAASMEGFGLSQNYPNPFSQETEINYQLPKASDVRIVIFDIQGRYIRTLVNQKQNPGSYVVAWDGTDMTGGQVTSGVYVVQMESEGFRAVNEMVLMR